MKNMKNIYQLLKTDFIKVLHMRHSFNPTPTGGLSDPEHYIFAYKGQTVYIDQFKMFEKTVS